MSAEQRAYGPAPDLLHGVEMLISHLLFWGGLLSVVVLLTGLGFYVVSRETRGEAIHLDRTVSAQPDAHSAQVYTSVRDIERGLSRRPIDPLAVAALGLVVLLLTPVLGVVLAIPSFLWALDFRYAAIATVVLMILIISFFVGGAAG